MYIKDYCKSNRSISMKKILGLDLGTTSVGWALVNEAENENEESSIVKLGVRIVSLSTDEIDQFKKGKAITVNADRTLKRGARRNLQRYKLRRETLKSILKNNGFIEESSVLAEHGNKTTFETYQLRAKAVTEKISLLELARVLLMINKKRGYKSNRKANSTDEGQLIDGMEIAKKLYEEDLTPGAYVLSILEAGKNPKKIDFYRSDLQAEFDKIWYQQEKYYPNELNAQLKKELLNKNNKQTWVICKEPFKLVGIKRSVKGFELKKENYTWRTKALSEQLSLEELVIVFQEINKELSGSSNYLGNISDRSKELYFNKETVGQYLAKNISNNSHFSVKNKVFYRQDYLDEFESIWETQAKFHPQLTEDLKKEIRDVVIFYQRPLKSQKSLISFCEFEQKKIIVNDKSKIVGLRVSPKSSPLFQEFKIWSIINNLRISDSAENISSAVLPQEAKEKLFEELNIRDKMTAVEALKLLYPKNYRDLSLNYKELEGNHTQAALFSIYQEILELSGHDLLNFKKESASNILNKLKEVFSALNIKTDFINFDSSLADPQFEQQAMYKLWHLLYSFEGDNSTTGDEKLVDAIAKLCGCSKEYAKLFTKVVFKEDYGSLSTKAMRKILPFLKQGLDYSEACKSAGYRHSKSSLTKEELENKVYLDVLELLPRNSLRNPVVEKILNQMILVVNEISKTYGKPDEIRIELARELKKSAKEREDMTKNISKATDEHNKYREILKNEFNIQNPSRNDLIRYKLYLELQDNGYNTLYSNNYISKEELFSKKFDVDHIIPQSKRFDDSFSNKTLELRSVNIEKGNRTAYDYVVDKGVSDDFIERVKRLDSLSNTKKNNLFTSEKNISDGFIERDLRETQYIAKKAHEILKDFVKEVVPTTGSITNRLREDWQLIDIMQELNWDKYHNLGLTETYKDEDGRTIKRISGWTKRNDHRHHALDALTVAFTKRAYIQYLNHLNAKSDETSPIYAIKKKYLEKSSKNKVRFIPPIPLTEFRKQAKEHLENILISIKAKNKVVTKNFNVTKSKKGKLNKTLQLTPRGQLHKETIYGASQKPVVKIEKIDSKFDLEKIMTVTKANYREALLKRLAKHNNDPKLAFTGKNSLSKNPIYLNILQTLQVPEKVKTCALETQYTIRKNIDDNLNLEKVVDPKIKEVLFNRLQQFNHNKKEAFSNLDENPIWLNQSQGIAIKRVTITGVSNAIALHHKKDHLGEFILNENQEKHSNDFVDTGNNHHVAIYRDAKGKLQENIVSFFEATRRAVHGEPIVDKTYKQNESYQFLFTMKQNEYFVFSKPELGFDPLQIDLLDPQNASIISPHLFRVQKLSSKYYVFRHHLETNVEDVKELRALAWERIQNLDALEKLVKVRVNHIGQIVCVGEY